MQRSLRCVLAPILALALFVAPAQAGVDVITKEFAQGANTAWSDCPWGDVAPADGQICQTYSVFFARFDGTSGGGGLDRRLPLDASLTISSERFHAESDSFELVAVEAGDTTNVTGFYDAARLRFAHMDAPAPIALSRVDLATGDLTPTGHTATLGAMTWTGYGDVIVFGNDGPGLGGLGHFADRCATANFNARQRIRPAKISATRPTIDGVAVEAPFIPDPPAAILDGVFHVMVVAHHC